MLDELHVQNYALVRDAHLSFSGKCTVLSGETGAGKTALVGAIKMLIGERGDQNVITDGTDEMVVEGRIFDGDSEHVIARKLSREGRSRCSFDGEMTTVKGLSEQVGAFFDLHGQHEHQTLLSASTQLRYLDRYLGATGAKALAAYEAAWEKFQATQRRLADLTSAQFASKQVLENAAFTVREIGAVNPREGEYEELEARLPILRHGESLSVAAQLAYALLRDEGGITEKLSEAARQLAGAGGVDPELDALAAQMESLAIAADDLATSMRVYRDSVEFDANALDEALSRLGSLDGLRKRFGPQMAEVFAALSEATSQLAMTENSAEKIRLCEAELASSEEELRRAAGQLTHERCQGGERLSAQLNEALKDLAFVGAELSFAFKPLPFNAWGPSGDSAIELLYQPSAASLPRPLAKIASGGELSRVMLALKTLQVVPDAAMTLVFDEVDAGIGGATANAVAAYIRKLAEQQQVIVVTHLAQIAAVADRHFVVEKDHADKAASTKIHEVQAEERVIEVARMLSGSSDRLALDHARQLLEGGV